jgi:catechol 2,3-dioxygenase-like lactoylglutathione lyase family enzyme
MTRLLVANRGVNARAALPFRSLLTSPDVVTGYTRAVLEPGANPMADASLVILYVDSPPASAGFYGDLLGKPALEASPTFAMLPFRDGVMLGLWSRASVAPASAAAAGGTELAFTVGTADEVDGLHDDWRDRGLPIAQAPTDMDFGRTFVALDPDGHRLRVFAPTMP